MSNRTSLAVSAGILILAGCGHPKPDAKVEEAMGLAERQIGQRPAWTVPWDENWRNWDRQSVLRLEDALAVCLRNNRQLRADLETIGQADADLVQAGLMQNPVINFMIMFPSGGGRSMLRGAGLPLQPLEDLWLIPARQEVARAELQRAVLRVADRAVETAAEAKVAYAKLQYSQRAIELVKDSMQIVEQAVATIRARQAAGRATQVEVSIFQIRLLKLRSELMAMEAEHRTTQRELLLLMGVAASGDGWRVEPVHEMQAQLSAPEGEKTLFETAVAQRLDVKASEWTLEAAHCRIEEMAREGWPKIRVGLGLERSPAPRSNNQSFAGRIGNEVTKKVLERAQGMQSAAMLAPFSVKTREVEYTVGPMFEMEVPLFDRKQAQVAKAVHEYQQTLAEHEARVQEVVKAVRQRCVACTQAYNQVRFFRESILPELEQNVVVARQSYVTGKEDLTVYLQVQEDLIVNRLKVLEYLRDYLVSRAELERQVGGQWVIPSPTSQPTSAPSETAGAGGGTPASLSG